MLNLGKCETFARGADQQVINRFAGLAPKKLWPREHIPRGSSLPSAKNSDCNPSRHTILEIYSSMGGGATG
jgi:hypothetical protein